MASFPNVLCNFQDYSRSYFMACASTAVLMNFLVMFMLVVQKSSQKGVGCNRVMLFSLALCDLLYEATTTTLFLENNSCKDAGNCQMLYFFYLALNLCTMFHIFVDIIHKTILEFGRPYHDTLPSRVCWSAASWIAAFGVAYVDLKTRNGLLDASYMAFLGRFKAFGYMLLMVIFCSGILVVIFTQLCTAKAPAAMKKSPFEKFHPPKMNQREIDSAASASQRNFDLVFTCLFMCIFVAWCGWVILAVDSRALKTVEVMKSFEVIRLAARIMGPMTILHTLGHKRGLL